MRQMSVLFPLAPGSWFALQGIVGDLAGRAWRIWMAFLGGNGWEVDGVVKWEGFGCVLIWVGWLSGWLSDSWRK